MGTSDEDDGYRKALRDVVQGLSDQLGTVRHQMATDLADYLARYRDDANRSIMALAARMLRVEDVLEKDGQERQRRQQEIDGVLASIRTDVDAIRAGQRGRNWQQWAQLGLLVLLLIAVVIALFVQR